MIKLRKKKTEENLPDTRLGNCFLDTAPKAWGAKEKINWTMSKINYFCAANDIVNTLKNLRPITNFKNQFVLIVILRQMVSQWLQNQK